MLHTKRSEPRLAFASLLETGAVKPGQALHDSRRRMRAQVRADGLIAVGTIAGSTHKVGALVQGLPACIGWTFWHVEEAGVLKPIGVLRERPRKGMKQV